jgi:hypothetical protein
MRKLRQREVKYLVLGAMWSFRDGAGLAVLLLQKALNPFPPSQLLFGS